MMEVKTLSKSDRDEVASDVVALIYALVALLISFLCGGTLVWFIMR